MTGSGYETNILTNKNKIMKTIKIVLTLVIAVLIFGSLKAQDDTYTLKIEITGLESSTGKVMVELLDEDQKTVDDVEVVITNNKSVVVFENLPAGTYAVQYFHDENSNGEMDTGMFGAPVEGYGFSNDARGFMGPPDFEDQLFSLDQNLTLVLKTKN
jgi:uncharacterized protein (DUF2141 family)